MYNFTYNLDGITYTETVSNDKEEFYDNHCHSCFELILIENGKVNTVIEGKSYSVSAPCVIALHPLYYHSLSPLKNCPYIRTTLMFQKESLPSEIADVFSVSLKKQPIVNLPTVNAISKKISQILSDKEIDKYVPLLHAKSVELFYEIALSDESDGNQLDSKTNKTVIETIKYIDENISKNISLNDIANHVYVSTSTLCHVFKDEMNITVKQYILQKKISYATMLLENGFTAISAAQSIGYSNYINFFKIYKKITGLSPNQTVKNAKR